MADYSNGRLVGDRVKVETIAWGENPHFIGKTGTVVRVDRNDVHQPIKVKLDDTGTEEWVKTVSPIPVGGEPVTELGKFKKKLYDTVMAKKAEHDWCDDADDILRTLGAFPKETTPEPKEGSVVGFEGISGRYVYRRMTGYLNGSRSWSKTGDEDEYSWEQVLRNHPRDTVRILFEPGVGPLPKEIAKVPANWDA